MSSSNRTPIYVSIAGLAAVSLWAIWPEPRLGAALSPRALIETSDAAFAASDPSYTNIIISGKTMIIRAADGHTPTVINGKSKPIVILERNPDQNSGTSFDKVTVENDRD